MTVRCVFKANDILGEGPVWSGEEQALYWVDIKRPALQRWYPGTEEHTVWTMPADIGCFALRAKGGAVVALQTGLACFDFSTEAFIPICNPEIGLPENRFNDGKCDRQGRFWAGTMDETEALPRGGLYRLDPGPDGVCHKMHSQITVSNGLGWSPDNDTMYYTDSPTRTIFAFNFNPATGAITDKRVFARDTVGFPDGLTVDAAGYVWSAKWDGWKVVRYAPNGTIEREITMPVQRPTSCMFGGPNLRRLYITSAKIGLSSQALSRQPLAGAVFSVDTEASGLPEPRFAG